MSEILLAPIFENRPVLNQNNYRATRSGFIVRRGRYFYFVSLETRSKLLLHKVTTFLEAEVYMNKMNEENKEWRKLEINREINKIKNTREITINISKNINSGPINIIVE